MNKLIFAFFLTLLTFQAEAQGYNSLNQAQLKLSLDQANKKISTGKTLTFLGSLTTIGGFALYISGLNGLIDENYTNDDSSTSKMFGGLFVSLGGIGMLGAGIPIWITSSNRKDKIELQLLKYNGSTSALGIGLRFTF